MNRSIADCTMNPAKARALIRSPKGGLFDETELSMADTAGVTVGDVAFELSFVANASFSTSRKSDKIVSGEISPNCSKSKQSFWVARRALRCVSGIGWLGSKSVVSHWTLICPVARFKSPVIRPVASEISDSHFAPTRNPPSQPETRISAGQS